MIFLDCKDTNKAKEKNKLASDAKTGDKRPQCDVCLKTFATRQILRRHEKIHTDRKRPFACPFPNCTSTFYRRAHLTAHQRVHSKNRDFACPHCQKAYKHVQTLQSHMRRNHPKK